jgi:hypothetical protein
VIPDLAALDLPGLVTRAGDPGTRVISATSWLLSLLALKLTPPGGCPTPMTGWQTRRRPVGRAWDLPKKSALTSSSYRRWHDTSPTSWPPGRPDDLLRLASGEQASSTWTSTRSCPGRRPDAGQPLRAQTIQRARSVLTFLAQDSGTHNLVYANADLHKATRPPRCSPSATMEGRQRR